MAAKRKPGVFCLEGEWDPKLTDRSSVRPFLQALEDLGYIQFAHRDVATVEELEHYLRKWTQARYANMGLLQLAFHGEQGAIAVGRKSVTLDHLAEMLEGRCAGRIIHFGSCSTMRATPKELAEFQRLTKAKAVCGYRREVDWLESAAFELLLIKALTDDGRIDSRFNGLRRDYPGLVSKLRFESYPRFKRVNGTA